MKLLILDKMRRLWFTWGVISFIGLFVFGLLLPTRSNSSFPQLWFLIIYFSFFVRSILELNTGYGRIALTLPFTTRQIGQALWFVSVGIPTMLLTFFSGIGLLIAALSSHHQGEVLLNWIQLMVLVFLSFGTFFWFQIVAPTPPPEKRLRRFAPTTGGLLMLALFGGGYLLYKLKWDIEFKYLAICFVGLIFTIWGWRRAEDVVADHQTSGRGFINIGNARRSFQPRTGFGGAGYLLAFFLSRLLGIAFLLFLFFAGMAAFESGHFFNFSRLASGMPMVMIWVLFIVVGGLAYLMVHLKFLRTLPMTSSQLAGVILTIALLPLLLASGIVAVIVGIQHGAPAGISLFKAYLMGAAPACVLAVAAVWHSEQRWGRIILAAVIFLISIIAPIYQATTGICNSGAKDMPLYFVLGYPLVAIFLAWRIIIRLLETHSMTYKARAQALRGWGKSWP